MKRAAFVFLTLLSACSFSQQEKCVDKGTTLIDAYYGFPDFYAQTTMRLFFEGASNIRVNSTGPLGLKGEHMLSNLIGIGFDVNYTHSELTCDYYKNTYRGESTATRALVGIIFHYARRETFEICSSAKMGYYNRTTVYSGITNNYYEERLNLVPIAVRIETMVRIFFNENFGANICVGIAGGPVLSAGLSAKF